MTFAKIPKILTALLMAGGLCVLSACSAIPSQEKTTMTVQSQQSPRNIVRIFELLIKPEKLDEFNKLGEHNIRQAVLTEQGVLAMYAVADKEQPNKIYVIEAYQDETAYEKHRQSPHFQAWLNGAKEMIISRKVIETKPVIFGSKAVNPKP